MPSSKNSSDRRVKCYSRKGNGAGYYRFVDGGITIESYEENYKSQRAFLEQVDTCGIARHPRIQHLVAGGSL